MKCSKSASKPNLYFRATYLDHLNSLIEWDAVPKTCTKNLSLRLQHEMNYLLIQSPSQSECSLKVKQIKLQFYFYSNIFRTKEGGTYVCKIVMCPLEAVISPVSLYLFVGFTDPIFECPNRIIRMKQVYHVILNS